MFVEVGVGKVGDNSHIVHRDIFLRRRTECAACDRCQTRDHCKERCEPNHRNRKCEFLNRKGKGKECKTNEGLSTKRVYRTDYNVKWRLFKLNNLECCLDAVM